MMNKQKKILIHILTVISILIMSSVVYGSSYSEEQGFTIGIITGKLSVEKGSTIDVILSIKDLKSSVNEINGLTAVIQYDKDVLTLDYKQKTSIDGTAYEITGQGLNGWGQPFYNPETNMIIVDGLEGTIGKEVVKLTFKVNDNVDIGTSTKISVTDLVSTDGVVDFKGIGSELTINIVEKSSEGEEGAGGLKPDDSNICTHELGSYTNNGDGTHTAKCSKCEYQHKENHPTNQKCDKCGFVPKELIENNKDNTTAKDNGYSHAGSGMMLIIVIGIILIISIILYKKNAKYNDII